MDAAQEKAKVLLSVLESKIAKARKHPIDFVNFVMREETTRRPIVCAPHQRVLLKFVTDHSHCVLMLPVGHSKSFSMAAVILYQLGIDPTCRGSIVSATQGQAAKVLGMVRDYIETSRELRAAFPALKPSARRADPWTTTAITVDRPAGIRDPSLQAVGLEGAINGSRLKFIVVDDVLTHENTLTREARNKTYDFLDSSVQSRLDVHDAKIVVTNTAWNDDDVAHRFIKQGWPALRMDIEGTIEIYNDDDWDCVELRPAFQGSTLCRLAAHDDVTPLWPERYPPSKIERLRASHLPQRFNQLYRNICYDESTAHCKSEWIELCKKVARQRQIYSLSHQYRGPNLTVTGVDLAVQQGEHNDETAFFTFEACPDGLRVILDIETGRFAGPDIVKKLIAKHRAYNSIIRLESNACFAPGSNVLTKQGYLPIERVTPGMEVWTHNARWRSVTRLIEGVAKTLCTVRAWGSLPVKCTPNHWFWLREAGRTSGGGGGHHRPIKPPTWVSAGFVDAPAYAGLAIPVWPKSTACIELESRRQKHTTVPVDIDIALLFGLFMAEGHCSVGQVLFTLGCKFVDLDEFCHCQLRRLVGSASIRTTFGDGTRRVIASNTALANVLRAFGKSSWKAPPIEWFGWPLDLRLGMVRGWLLGDGTVGWTNKKSKWPSRIIRACSISRNWMLFARSALFEAGYRPTISVVPAKRSHINGRSVACRALYIMGLNTEDSVRLQSTMSVFERKHWEEMALGMRVATSRIVLDDGFAWSKMRLPQPGGPFETYNGVVYNLEVEDDASFVVDDYVVHNAQDFVRQFALDADVSLPIKAHVTGRMKVHPEHGIEAIFVEMSNGAWAIPNDPLGNVSPQVAKFINACLNYTPTRHTEDVLIGAYLAREQAKAFGAGGKIKQTGATGSIAGAIMTR